jgi:hypothetical protein
MSTDPNAFLMGGGGRSAKFEAPGDQVTGTVISQEMRQQTEFSPNGAGKPEFWDNGDPKMQLVVKLQTSLREDADDDGVRAVYLKGGFKAPTTQKAVSDAVRAAGASGLETGGTLTLTYTGNGPATGGGFPPKYYTANYTPPAAQFLHGGSQVTAPAAVPVPAAPPVQAPTPAPAAAAPAAAAPAAAAPAAPAPGPAGGMVTLPDGSQVTAEVAALLAQVAPQAASA